MVRVMLVDDERLALDRLARLCGRLAGVDVVGGAQTGEDAIGKIKALQPELVLLDITMPERDGFAVAEVIKTMADPPAVIFVTAHEQYAVRAFDVAAVDYLLKPVELTRLEQAIGRGVRDRTIKSQDTPLDARYATEFWVPSRGGSTRVPVSELILVEAQRDYVRLLTFGGSHLLGATLARMALQLDPNTFVQIHRSYIVARAAIVAVINGGSGRFVKLRSGDVAPIGRTYAHRLEGRYKRTAIGKEHL